MPDPLWAPSPQRRARSHMTRVMAFAKERHAVGAREYGDLYRWSVAQPVDFWDAMWDFGGVRGSKGYRVAKDLDRMPGACFFPDATVNFTENVLAGAEKPRVAGDGPAIIFKTESAPIETMSWRELRDDVAACAAALRWAGIEPGDRVAAYLPN